MHLTPNHTAVLLFTRTPGAEALCKNFFAQPSVRHNQLLAQQLVGHAVQVAQQSTLPYFIITEQEQQGSTFGQKLTHAITSVFSKGFKKVIVIGNDCLGLTLATIIQANNALQHNDIVLGPTGKGGVYLIGLSAHAFKAGALQNIAWQTADVYGALTQYAAQNFFKTAYLPPLRDVNHYQDLVAAVQTLGSMGFLKSYVLSLLASFHQPIAPFIFFSNTIHVYGIKGLRAPPFSVS